MQNLFEEASALGVSVPKSLALSVKLFENADLPGESKAIICKGLEADDDFIKFTLAVEKAKAKLAAEEARLLAKEAELAVESLKERVKSSRLPIVLDDLEGTLISLFDIPENQSVISSGNDISLSGTFSAKWVDGSLKVESSYAITDSISKPRGGKSGGASDKITIDGVLIDNSRVWNVLCEMVNQSKIDKKDTNKLLKTDHSQSDTTYGWNNAVSMLPAHARNSIKLADISRSMSKEEGLQMIAKYIGKSLELVE